MNEEEIDLYLGFTISQYKMKYLVGIVKTYNFNFDYKLRKLMYNKYRYKKSDEKIFESYIDKVTKEQRLKFSKEFHNITMIRKKLRHKVGSIIVTNIKNAMESHGINLAKLSLAIKIKKSMLAIMLNETRPMNCSELYVISKYFNMPIEWFFIDHSLEYDVKDNSNL